MRSTFLFTHKSTTHRSAKYRSGRAPVAGTFIAALAWALSIGCDKPDENRQTESAGQSGVTASVDNRRLQDRSPNLETNIRFEDATESSQVRAVYQTGREAGHYAILESLGGGVGVLDFDQDGQDDLFFPQGGGFQDQAIFAIPSKLYRKRGNAIFEDVSASAKFATPNHYAHGCSISDFDSDGFPDLLVTGYGGLQLFQNCGDGSFVEVRQHAGLLDNKWSTSAAWGDLNGDSHPDLYVTHYVDWSFDNHPECPSSTADQPRDVCPPRAFNALADIIYENNGDGTFRDVSDRSRLRTDGKGLSVLVGDLDQDGDNDVYVANDMVDNFFYENNGQGILDDIGLLSGTATDLEGTPNGSMGIAVLDFDSDIDPDIGVTNFENEEFALYRNEGAGNFLHASRESGVASLGGRLVSFGTIAVDFDIDGDEDISVANGHVNYHPLFDNERQQQLLLENRGNSQFGRVRPKSDGYFDRLVIGRGIATADFDGDSRPDLVITHNDEPAAILLNRSTGTGKSVYVRVIGRSSERYAVGTHITLQTEAKNYYRTITGGGSYLSQGSARCHFGVPQSESVTRIIVTWPSGKNQTVEASLIGSDITIIEED